MAGLEVQIGADKSDFDKKIKEVEFDVKQLAKEKQAQIKLGLDTREITAQIKDAKKSLNDLKTTAKDAGNAIGKDFAQKTGNGSNALTQFSRIAQDAPYGIIGIGNNITATVESFGHLKNATGSTGGALKAMASSIMGSGGILLAVSLVTTAFTYMAQNGLTISDVVDKMTGKFDESRKAMQEMGAEATKSATAQIASVGAYVDAAKNINLSMSDRLIAVKKLQDEYPAYFGNLSTEQILNGDVASAVRSVTDALVAKAKASGLSGMISDNAKVMYQLDSQVDNINKQKQEWINMFKEVKKGSGDEARMLLGIRSFNARINDAITEKNKLNRDNLELTKEINKETAKTLKLEAPKVKVETKKATEKAEPVYFTPQVAPVQSSINATGLAETSGMVLQIARNVQGAEGMITTSMGNINIAFDTSGARMLEALQGFNESASQIIEGGIANTFAGLGAAIGNALATGGNVIQAAGSALLAGVGGLLTNLGTMAIEVGVGLLGIKAALTTLNPAVAIGAGVALIALGSVFSSKASALGSGGGSRSSGGGRSVSTGSSVSSPTSSTGGGGGSSFQGGTVVFEISGQSLIGVLGNTLDKNRRLGGSLGLG